MILSVVFFGQACDQLIEGLGCLNDKIILRITQGCSVQQCSEFNVLIRPNVILNLLRNFRGQRDSNLVTNYLREVISLCQVLRW